MYYKIWRIPVITMKTKNILDKTYHEKDYEGKDWSKTQ